MLTGSLLPAWQHGWESARRPQREALGMPAMAGQNLAPRCILFTGLAYSPRNKNKGPESIRAPPDEDFPSLVPFVLSMSHP